MTTSSPGCHLQRHNGLKQSGNNAPVRHPISLLAEVYRQ